MELSSIIIHHSLTRDSGTVSWNAIREYHVGTLGWRDIGYHYGVELINYEYEILLGRFENQTGAHAKGWNRSSIGICVVGDFDKYPPSPKQMNRTVDLVRYLMDTHNIPQRRVLGHRETFTQRAYSTKTCPGRAFDMDKFRKAVA